MSTNNTAVLLIGLLVAGALAAAVALSLHRGLEAADRRARQRRALVWARQENLLSAPGGTRTHT